MHPVILFPGPRSPQILGCYLQYNKTDPMKIANVPVFYTDFMTMHRIYTKLCIVIPVQFVFKCYL